MKKPILCILFACLFSYASGQIIINPNVSWQQFIPLITGGKGIAVHNIQVQGAPVQFGFYQAMSGELGLSQGIIMSSGNVTTAVGPNTLANSGMDVGTPGHILAQQIAGAGNPTFNAAVIEFDFSSPFQDTLQMKYLFGSEEYKEFVGSEYNDVFGFFVTSGPGITTPVNIALLPSSLIPIAINNVNHLTNSAYYHDNDIPPGPELQFDGWVHLTTEAFPVQPNQVYHIVLLVSDAGDPIYDSGVFLELIYGSQDLCGNIHYEGVPAGPGRVDLVGFRLDSADVLMEQTYFTDATGHFEFPDVPYGGYYIRSELDPVMYPAAYPVYLDSAALWGDADIKYLPSVDTACFELYHKNIIQGYGPGIITGKVLGAYEEKVIALNKTPDNCYVYAFDVNGIPVAKSRVEENGKFSLTGLEDGKYIVVVDKVLYQQADMPMIIIQGNELQQEVSFMVSDSEKKIRRIESDNTEMGLLLSIYPNPSEGNFNLLLSTDEVIRELNVSITDLTGRIIYTRQVANIPSGETSIRMDVSESIPASGMYILRFDFNGKSLNKKIQVNKY